MTGWPSTEATYVAILGAKLRLLVSTDVPEDVERLAGFVQVERGPGDDDGITDRPLLDVSAFHPDRVEAGRLAESVRQVMLGSANTAGTLIDSVTTASGPAWVFYARNVHRYVASYRVGLRRPR